MVLQTLVLAAGLLANGPASDTDLPKGNGWIVEVRGFHYHRDAAQMPKGEGWTIEIRGFHYHRHAAPKKELIIEFLWPQAQPPLQIDPVESHYYDDLRPFFELMKKQKR